MKNYIAEKHGISRNKLQSVIRRADRNRNGKVEYEDFLETVSDYRLKTEQASKITQIGKALAYAEEFTCWPPKLFIVLGKTTTFLLINIIQNFSNMSNNHSSFEISDPTLQSN